jgi:hypothetical protein
LEKGKIVARIRGDHPQNGEETAVFCLGDDLFGPGDNVVVGDEETVGRNKKTGTGAFHLSLIILDGKEVDGGPGLFGQGAEVGYLSGRECGRGQEQDKASDPEDHPLN